MRRFLLTALLLVPPGPDLRAGNLTLVSGTPGAGEQVFLGLEVSNPGPLPAGPFRVQALLSPALPVTARDAEIGSTEVPSMAAGAEIVVDLDAFIPASTAPGRYRLGAFVDPENLVLDGVRSNNGAATALFTVTRPPAAMDLGDDLDAGLGPLGTDGVDIWIGWSAEASVRARGMQGVRPVLRIREPGGGAVLAEQAGGTLRWTAFLDGVYRVEVGNLAETVGRVRLTTSGRSGFRSVDTTAPTEIPFVAWEDGSVVLSALYAGAAAPLLYRPPAGPVESSPGSARGRRARLGPVVPRVTGHGAIVMGGSGPVRFTVVSRTPRRGGLVVR
jgi:hypothetical protein